jgi:hypothetical protein
MTRIDLAKRGKDSGFSRLLKTVESATGALKGCGFQPRRKSFLIRQILGRRI